ncbi:hypothetical protein [Streptomyces sp. NPDC088258]|uniref:hypothetical protein n=1 Tax=Streptomyces sp. NPDC088258 TaxID=3365849 RepID=UPI0037FDE2AE
MSLIPTLTRHGRHRATDRVTELERQLQSQRTQLVNASNAIRDLQQDRRDALDASDRLRTRICALSVERDQLAETVATLRERASTDANTNAITVPQMNRDTSNPADQATEPIAVSTLWAALDPARNPPAA